jgi:acetyl-CoA acyltransferase
MKAVISAYARSPFHFARKGKLAETRPEDIAAQVVQGVVQRTGIAPA